jgi:hypothetical protein
MKTGKLLLGLGLSVMLSATAFAHNGMFEFIPEIPPALVDDMVMDGDEGDWGWYDTAFAIDTSTLNSIAGPTAGLPVDPASLDIVYFTAWSAEPDNRFYWFTRVFDDTLKVDTEDPAGWWQDDQVALGFDPDHSGGLFRSTEGDQAILANGVYYSFRVLPENVAGEQVRYEYVARPEWTDDTGTWWIAEPPVVIGNWTVNPPDAVHGATNVTMTHEVAFQLFDDMQARREDSVRHILQPEKILHFGIQYQDGDTNFQAQLTGCRADGCIDGVWQNGDQDSDYFPIEAGDVTAVENTSWGRIKYTMDQSLE